MRNGVTSLRVHKTTNTALDRHKTPGESRESVVLRLIEFYEDNHEDHEEDDETV